MVENNFPYHKRIVPMLCVTAIKLSRHLGRDCRDPDHMDVEVLTHPWLLDSGNPCRNDVLLLNLMAEHGHPKRKLFIAKSLVWISRPSISLVPENEYGSVLRHAG